MIFINQLLSAISHYQIGEYFFLGKILHFIIPMIVTITLFKRGVDLKKILALVFLLGLGKELYDMTAINSSALDSLYDIILDLSYPLFFMLVTFVKKMSETTPNHRVKSSATYSLYLKSKNACFHNHKIH